MSTATADPTAEPVPVRKGKKKLFILVGAAVLVLGLVGGGAVFFMKTRAAAIAAAEGGDDTTAALHSQAHKRDPNVVPTFVPLDPFTVNLADRDAERYAQVGLSLELSDPKEADHIKTYMPVIRNNILMVLAHKTSAELLERDGKVTLAREIQRETSRALGVEIDKPVDKKATPVDPSASANKGPPKRPLTEIELPVRAVHFSNFIIQ